MASSILRVSIKKCSHVSGGVNELRPFSNGMSMKDLCFFYHPPIDRQKLPGSSQSDTKDFILVGKREEKKEGMTLYDTVLVGDLSKFGIKYVNIECKPDQDPEELKTIVETTTKKASCAFELF